MNLTKVLIIGRPNVGKSSLFNRLIKNKRALVLNRPGVTRDILKGTAHWWGSSFEVWDSGGLTWTPETSVFSLVQESVCQAIREADLVVMVMDVRLGLGDDDKSIYKQIRNKNHLLVVNKVDHPSLSEVSEFYSLGSSFIQTAFEKDVNIDQIVEWILKNLKDKTESSSSKQQTSLLLTGQSNVGKSSLCNLLLKKNRMITSEKPHTTTDIVDDQFEFEGKQYKILDTAGIRKKSRRFESLEKISAAKSLSYFEKADIIFLVIDGEKGLSRQDQRLFSYCMDIFKPCILVVNKWDLVQISKISFRKKIKEGLSFFPNLPVTFTSAQTGLGVHVLMKAVNQCVDKIHTKISTSELNRFFERLTLSNPAPMYGSKNIKFYFSTQSKKPPPRFIIFTNEPKGIPASYKKFLTKKIQENWKLTSIPIQISFVQRK